MNFSFWLDDIYLSPSKYISSATASLLATFCSFQLYAAFFSFIQYHRAPSSSNLHHPTSSDYIQLYPVPASIANLLQVSSRRPSFCQFMRGRFICLQIGSFGKTTINYPIVCAGKCRLGLRFNPLSGRCASRSHRRWLKSGCASNL